jgi:hypothetical protein
MRYRRATQATVTDSPLIADPAEERKRPLPHSPGNSRLQLPTVLQAATGCQMR